MYILSSGRRKLTVGYSDDIRRAVFEQQRRNGQDSRPKLVYYETLLEVRPAIDRLIGLENLTKQQKIRLIEAVNPLWDDLSSEWQWGREANYSDS